MNQSLADRTIEPKTTPHERQLTVVKIGGAAGIDFGPLCDDIAALSRQGRRFIIVHGGSDATTTLSRRLGLEPQFITSPSGHTSRRTDRATLEAFQMACRGIVNQELVRRLVQSGVNAVGLSGLDARLWAGPRKAAVRAIEDGRVRIIRDDYTGAVERVDPRVLTTLLDAGFMPVVSPPALSEACEPINVDADRAAAQTAVALGAQTLIMLSNVPGVLRTAHDDTTLIRCVLRSGLASMDAVAQGRMKNKVLAAREALEGGVSRVIIGDARAASPLSMALEGAGTVFA
ncbi:MAG: [LysW]-aminoadipate kinase [Tepidisphaera sp.]|nr:[LysW]-aminoadipate kinase [Tepidisphaera sp.]